MQVERATIQCPSGNAYVFPLPADKIAELLPAVWLQETTPVPACVEAADALHVRTALVAATLVAQWEARTPNRYTVPTDIKGGRQWARHAVRTAARAPSLEAFAADVATVLLDYLLRDLRPQGTFDKIRDDLQASDRGKSSQAKCLQKNTLAFYGYWHARLAVEYLRLRGQGHTPDQIARAIADEVS
ncbi:MAG: hypothetical protein ACM3SV_03600 [Betaproteobacteria bacterium]